MSKEYDVLTLGETMIRLSPPGYQRLEQTSVLDLHIGGSESNTAVGLSRLGLRAAWVSRLPDNPLGRRVAQELRGQGVDVSSVAWCHEGRMGVYFVEYGRGPRAINVLYDRDGSAMSQMTPADFNLEIVSKSRLIHLTGITVALSSSCHQLVETLLDEAHRAGVVRSFDINYRSKLWSPEEACRALDPLCQGIDILFITRDDAQIVFGCEGTAEEVAWALKRRFKAGTVSLTLGAEGAMTIDESGQLYAATPSRTVAVDRLGAGDAFSAGFLYGYLQDDVALGIDLGTAMAALKYTIPGDLPLIDLADLEPLLGGKGAYPESWSGPGLVQGSAGIKR